MRPPVERFLRAVFSGWDADGVAYVVLRNHDTLPERVGNDVDVLVAPGLRGAAERRLLASAREAGYRLHHRAEFSPRCLYFSRGRHQLQVDLFRDLRWRGLLILPVETLLAGRRRARGLWVPDGSTEAALTLLTGLLYRGELKPKYRDLVRGAFVRDPGAMRAHLAEAIGGGAAARLGRRVLAGDWEAAGAMAPSVRRALLGRRLRGAPRDSARGILRDARRLLGRFRRPPGLSVALLGPDGCGKSTIAARLVDELAGTFPPEKARYIHWKPRVLPLPGHRTGAPVREPHAEPPRGRRASTAFFLFHLFEFIAGWQLRVRPVLFRNGLVVLDRYYDDFRVDPLRYRLDLPARLVGWGGRLVPSPDAVFLLDAPAAELVARKGELSAAEAERQRRAFRRAVAALPNARIVDAGRPPREVAAACATHLLDDLARRVGSGAGP